MSGSLALRRYRPSDHERVLELHEAAMRDVGAYVDGVPEPDLDDIEGAYFDSGGEFLVGTVDGDIVAMGAFRPAEGYISEFLDGLSNPAELKRMRVDPTHQRRGYGRRVYEELEQRARNRGFDEFVLDTMPVQTAARAFYESAGFEQVRRERLEHDGDTFTLLFYRRPLGEE
ncbi:GNAT family N-acetyltransferase [Natronomonas halophila]|uniref:GNAT family N-acetyltransferase n=1 Tax=Natronomonas halophila TaxID=2747817 RepID=UPI0015B45CDB|nr:GNAT family N-acetyltransferase [Natronomonas halophila]QLD86683.1 GNAT family N-acetyltransferase [Natronomonas halophila]